MAVRHDIQLLEDDFVFANGDFKIAESDEQHIQDTINAFPGWWKQYPDEGVGIRAWQKSPAIIQQMSKTIRVQLALDNYKSSPKIAFDSSGTLKIAPNVSL